MPTYSAGLSGLRGLAAATVVIYHALLVFRMDGFDDPHRLPLEPDEEWFLLGHALTALFNGSAAVILFFVLSGTVLALSLARSEGVRVEGLVAFYMKRAFRLGPLLIVVTLAAAWMHHAYFDGRDIEAGTSWMNSYYRHDPGPKEILANAVGWRNSLNSPAWTIFIEICASVVFPALYILSTRKRPVALVTLVVLAVAALTSTRLRHVDTFLICFYVGALVPRLGGPVADRFFRLPGGMQAVLVLATLTVMGWFGRVYSPTVHIEPVTTLVATGCAAFLVTVTFFAPSGGVLAWRPVVFLGEIAYGVYLIHFVVLFAIAHAIGPDASPRLAPDEAILLNLGLGVVTLTVTAVLASLTYYAVESPCQRVGRKAAGAIVRASPALGGATRPWLWRTGDRRKSAS